MQQRIRSGTRLRRVPADAFCVVKSVIAGGATVLIMASLIAGNVYADRPVRQVSPQRRQKRSSSLLPVHSFQNASKFLVSGPATYSPLRVIDRKEIDQTGRPTTAAAVANEPSVRILWRLTPGLITRASETDICGTRPPRVSEMVPSPFSPGMASRATPVRSH